VGGRYNVLRTQKIMLEGYKVQIGKRNLTAEDVGIEI